MAVLPLELSCKTTRVELQGSFVTMALKQAIQTTINPYVISMWQLQLDSLPTAVVGTITGTNAPGPVSHRVG